MSFIIFKKERKANSWEYQNLNLNYKLAGYQLIYKLWNKKNKPVNQGWSLTADEILQEYDSNMSYEKNALIIDFHPDSKKRIALIEIENIYLFTYGNSETAFWSPIMLELSDVYYEEEYEDLTKDEKEKIIATFETPFSSKRTIEFLYLHGNENKWGWGRNGSTNAAFIEGEARNYFRNFF